MRLAFIRPAEGVCVPIPGTASIVPPAGRTFDLEHPYWAARLAEGSIVEAPTPSAPAPARGTAKD